jgi:hypothetical protein
MVVDAESMVPGDDVRAVGVEVLLVAAGNWGRTDEDEVGVVFGLVSAESVVPGDDAAPAGGGRWIVITESWSRTDAAA